MECAIRQPTMHLLLRNVANNLVGLSVVVPTFGRVSMCERLLRSLKTSKEQSPYLVEVIVVDDSPPEEARRIEKLCERYQARYFFYDKGISAKRNHGVAQASFPIVLFIDSDCEVNSETLTQHLDVYNMDPDAVAVLGRTDFRGPTSFVWEAVQYTPFLAAFRFADSHDDRLWGPSNNLSCKKQIFQMVGGFDERSFIKPGGEDVDLGYRFHEAGFTLQTNPNALVYHTTETWQTFRQMTKRLFNWGRGEFFLHYNYGEKLFFDCPKGMGLFLVMIPLALILTGVLLQFHWLLLPFLFLAINFASRLVMHFCYHPERIKHASRVVTAEVFNAVYEAGLTYQCLRSRWLAPLFHRLIFQPEDGIVVWNFQVLNTWITFFQLLLSLALFQLLCNSL